MMKISKIIIFLFIINLNIILIFALKVNIPSPTTYGNYSLVNVNSSETSETWITTAGNLDNVNTTQMEESAGYLNILETWLNSGWCALTGCDMTGNITTTEWFNGKFNWTSADDWNIFTGSSLSFNASKFDSTYHNPITSYAYTGTIDGGTLADVQHSDAKYDGVTFNFSEEVGGLDLRLNFTGLTIDTFSRGIMRYKTSNLKGDFPIVQMWNYDDSVWEDYPQLIESETFATMTQPVFDGEDHIQDGIAQMRIYKDGGNTQNHYYVDWVAIVSGIGLPIGEEVDPIFNIWLHNPIFENNVDLGGNNITNVNTINTTNLYVDNIAEKTARHNVVFNDNVDLGSHDFTTSGSIKSYTDANNEIIIDSDPTTARGITFTKTPTVTTTNYGIDLSYNWQPTADAVGNYLYGLNFAPFLDNDKAVGVVSALNCNTGVRNGGTITYATALKLQTSNILSTITNAIGVDLVVNNFAGTIENYKGINAPDLSGVGSISSWFIYSAGGNNYFGNDNSKSMWGTTNTDLQISSDGTNPVYNSTGVHTFYNTTGLGVIRVGSIVYSSPENKDYSALDKLINPIELTTAPTELSLDRKSDLEFHQSFPEEVQSIIQVKDPNNCWEEIDKYCWIEIVDDEVEERICKDEKPSDIKEEDIETVYREECGIKEELVIDAGNWNMFNYKGIYELKQENDDLKTELCKLGSEKYKLEGYC